MPIATWVGVCVVGLAAFAVVAGVSLVLLTRPPRASGFGVFEGEFRAELVDGAERMRLREPFTYYTPDGVLIALLPGYEWDGASIPRFFWRLVGHPFTSSYRRASLVHDWLCESHALAWQDAHAILYYACRLSGVGWWQARRIYAAVYWFGPTW